MKGSLSQMTPIIGDFNFLRLENTSDHPQIVPASSDDFEKSWFYGITRLVQTMNREWMFIPQSQPTTHWNIQSLTRVIHQVL